jgi:tetratricopeptide (TPR) repeat protein
MGRNKLRDALNKSDLSATLPSFASFVQARGGLVEEVDVPGIAGNALREFRRWLSRPLHSFFVHGPKDSGWLAATKPPHFGRLDFVRDWTVNAVAAECIEKPVILFNAGAVFAILNLFSWLLSREGFLKSFGDQGKTITGDIETIELNSIFSLSRTGNSSAMGLSAVLEYIRVTPLCPRGWVRQQLAAVLARDALDFLLRHELAHVEAGHLQLLVQRKFTEPLSEFFAMGGRELAPEVREIILPLELAADQISAKELLSQKFDVTTAGGQSLWAMPGCLFHFHPSRKPAAVETFEISVEDELRLLIVTGGVLFQLFARLEMPLETNAEHPPTHVRILAFIEALKEGAQALCGHQASEVREAFEVARTNALEDLEQSAALLHLQPLLKDGTGSNEIESLRGRLEAVTDLGECRRRARSFYYTVDGFPVNRKEYYNEVLHEDKGKLENQSVIKYAPDKSVESILTWKMPTSPVEILSRGAAWACDGRYEEALEDINYALSVEPENQIAARIAAYIMRTMTIGQTGEGKYVPDEDVCNADNALIEGKVDIALREYDRLLRERPKDRLHILSNRGSYLAHIKDFDGAFRDYTEALSIDPDYVSVLLNRAISNDTIGAYSEALKDMERVIELEPVRYFHYLRRSQLLKTLLNFERALEDANTAVMLAPWTADPFYARASLLIHLKQFRRAIPDLKRIVELGPGSDEGKWATAILAKIEERLS